MLRLLLLCLASASAYAVSNPEIATKSGKSTSSTSIQQQVSQKAASQRDDPLLNSISAYAHQYESVTPPNSYSITPQLYSQPYTQSTSLKLSNSPQLPSSPTIEANFQPMPLPHNHQGHIHPPHNPPTPVIMQYLPQSQINDGVQYLQLIPTRPLIVPISPYMSQPYQAPQVISPTLNDYSGRSLVLAEPDPSTNIPYGIQAYANNLQNYRSYRINREIKPNNTPTGMSLNMNEYMPSPSDAPKSTMNRGRP